MRTGQEGQPEPAGSQPAQNQTSLEDQLRGVAGGATQLSGALAALSGAFVVALLIPGISPLVGTKGPACKAVAPANQAGLWELTVILLMLATAAYAVSANYSVWGKIGADPKHLRRCAARSLLGWALGNLLLIGAVLVMLLINELALAYAVGAVGLSVVVAWTIGIVARARRILYPTDH